MLQGSARESNAGLSTRHLSRWPTLDVVRSYIRLGFCAIAISPGKKSPLPGLKWKQYQERHPTEAELIKWFSRGTAGIGIVLGAVSGGLIARDFDKRESYDRWALEHPELAISLPTVETARGMHVYCIADLAQVRAATSTGDGGIVILDDEGELRGEGSYVLAPPTVHPSGHVYRWIVPLVDRPPLLDLRESGLLSRVPCVSQFPTESAEECRECGRAQKSEETTDAIGCVGGWGESYGSETAQRIEQAIQSTLPPSVGHRDDWVWKFCRALKAIEVWADADTLDLEDIVREWHGRAKPFIGTQPFQTTLAA